MTEAAHILVAEDERSVREFLTRTLEHAGYTVTAASDGQNALEILHADNGFDLLLTDIVMPRVDGIALALKVAKAYPWVRIMMMTGYSDQRIRAHNLECLAHEVIAKPFAMDDIIAKIKLVLSQERKK
jgi:two-component system cell cycle response regulator CpdR